MSTLSQPRFYVYILARPNGKPFYVGKGSGPRVFRHEQDAARGCDCYKCRVIRKIWRQGGQVQKYIVFTTDDEQEAFDHERSLIELHGRKNLCNLTDGGDGASGQVQSSAVRAQRSAKMKATLSTPQAREKRSAEQKKAWSDPVRRAQITERNRQNALDPEHCRKVSEGLKSALASPEARERRRAEARARWADPAYREKQCAAARKRWSSPEARAIQSAKIIAQRKAKESGSD